jgi:DUF1707 SHOCT-like domain
MTRQATLRASDADRELVAERLRHAAAEGRLFADELEERLGTALSARTYGELDALVADLPPITSPARRAGGNVRVRPAVAVAVALPLALMLIGAIAFAVAGHAHPGRHGEGLASGAPLIWLVWIALGWRYLTRRRRGTR